MLEGEAMDLYWKWWKPREPLLFSYLIAVTKSVNNQRRRDLFWFIVWTGLVCTRLVPTLGQSMVAGTCSRWGCSLRGRRAEKNACIGLAFKKYSDYVTSPLPATFRVSTYWVHPGVKIRSKAGSVSHQFRRGVCVQPCRQWLWITREPRHSFKGMAWSLQGTGRQ